MQLTIFHIGGTEKVVEFEDITANGWVQVRYPHGAGCYQFALAHGRIETKRGEQALWALSVPDLNAMRELAKERGIKWKKGRARRLAGKPKSSKTAPPSKQVELFE